ncbi:MAG: hypothetical protein ACI4C0_01570, partial [Lachnospiraceae bacterium]
AFVFWYAFLLDWLAKNRLPGILISLLSFSGMPFCLIGLPRIGSRAYLSACFHFPVCLFA